MKGVVATEHGVDSALHAQFRANSPVTSSDLPLDNIVQLHQPELTTDSPRFGPTTGLRSAHWGHRFAKREDGIFDAAVQLKALGAKRKLRTQLFTKNGDYRHKDRSGNDLFAMSPDEAFEHVIGVYKPIYDGIEYYLDEPTADTRPYNAHGEIHVRNVHRRATRLLREAGHTGKPNRFRRSQFQYPQDLRPSQIETEGAIADATHDGGYFYNPDEHPEQGVELMLVTLPQLSERPREASRVARAVRLHEGDNLSAAMREAGIRSHEEAIQFLAMEYPIVPALIIADKADQNRERVRKGELLQQKAIFTDPKLFLEDPHVETNLLLETGFVGWDRVQDSDFGPLITFRIEFTFDQDIDPEELGELQYFAVPRRGRGGYMIDISQQTQADLMTDERRRRLDLLMDKNNSIGAQRQVAMVLSSFALNPEQQRADIIYRDAQTGYFQGYTFYRHRIDQDIENYWAAVPEKTRSKRGPWELKI